MKKLILYSFAITMALISVSCNHSNKAHIEGEILGFTPKYVYLTEYNLTFEKIIDSIKVSPKGKFKLNIKLSQPQLYKVYVPGNSFAWLLLSPGEKARLKFICGPNTNTYEIEGSQYSQQIKELNTRLELSQKILDSLQKSFIIIPSSEVTKKDSLILQYKRVIDDQRKFSLNFILKNLRSPASIIALYQQFNDSLYVFYKPTDLQYVKILSDTLSKYYPESNIVKALYADRNRLLSQYQELRRRNSFYSLSNAKVRSFPEINLRDINGNMVSLTSSVDRLMLLTFWTPASTDCQTVMNSISSLYHKYHSKGLDLYSVALFDDEGYWKNALMKLRLPGIQVIDPMAESSVAASVYNVSHLPYTVLITRDGIVAFNIFGDKLEQEIIKHLSR
jgi:peroxiredoxin